MPAYESRAAGQIEVLSEVLACLILRGPDDSLLVGAEEQRRLYELFPQGYGVVIYGASEQSGLRVTLVGEAAREIVDMLVGELEQGREVSLPRGFTAGADAT